MYTGAVVMVSRISIIWGAVSIPAIATAKPAIAVRVVVRCSISRCACRLCRLCTCAIVMVSRISIIWSTISISAITTAKPAIAVVIIVSRSAVIITVSRRGCCTGPVNTYYAVIVVIRLGVSGGLC